MIVALTIQLMLSMVNLLSNGHFYTTVIQENYVKLRFLFNSRLVKLTNCKKVLVISTQMNSVFICRRINGIQVLTDTLING